MGLAQAYLVVQRQSAVGAVVVVVTRIVDVVDYVSLAGLIQGRGYPQRQDDTIDNHKISVADAPSTNSFQSQLSRRLETRKNQIYKYLHATRQQLSILFIIAVSTTPMVSDKVAHTTSCHITRLGHPLNNSP